MIPTSLGRVVIYILFLLVIFSIPLQDWTAQLCLQHAQSSAVSSQQYPEYGNQPFSPPRANLGNPYCWFWLPESCPPLGSISLCFTPSAGAVLVSGSPLSPGRSHHIPSDKEKPCKLSLSSLRVLHFSAPMGFPPNGARGPLGLALPLA